MTPPPPPEPLYVLRGHRAAVQCVAFTPDCQALAAGDAEGELKLWDLESRRVTSSIKAHECHSGILQVACPANSSNGEPWVISQGRDGVVKCWQLHSACSISSVPVYVITSGSYNFCRFALLQPGQASSSCPLTEAAASTAALAGSPSASSSGGVGTETEQLGVVEGFQLPSDTAALHVQACTDRTDRQQHSRQGLLAQKFKKLQLDMTTQQPAAGLMTTLEQDQEHNTAAGGVSVMPQQEVPSSIAVDLTEELEEQLMLGSKQCDIAGVDAPPSSEVTAATTNMSGSHQHTPSSHSSTTTTGLCMLALPAEDAADIGIWQIGTQGKTQVHKPAILLRQERTKERPSHGLCMAITLLQPQGSAVHAITGHEDGTLALWDTRNPNHCLTATRVHSESIMSLAVAPNCQSGFSGAADEAIAAFELSIPQAKLSLVKKLELPGKPGVADIAIRTDGRIAATAGWDSKIRIWHARKRQPLAVLRWHNQQMACVGFSGDNRLLAAGSRDNHISIWSIYPPDKG